jgi:aminoglycoside phosphotransferase (APT) family kinase protein
VEILRSDFLMYFDAIRKSLASIQTELTSAKSIDEIDCIDRILCLCEAEIRYRDENLAHMQQALDGVLELLQPALQTEPLRDFASDLAHWQAMTWQTSESRLAAQRALLQRHIPALTQLAGAGDAGANQALAQLLQNETAQYTRIHALRESFFVLPNPAVGAVNDPAAATPGSVPTAAMLQDYLRSTFPREADLQVVDVHNLPGGRSKETTLIGLTGTRDLPARIVMRSDIEGGLVPSRTADEFRVLQVVERHGGVPVPHMLCCETDKSKLGSSFLLMSAVTGRARGAYNPDVRSRLQPPLDIDREHVGKQLAWILAQLHRIDIRELGNTHLATTINLQQQVRETIENTYRQATIFDYPSRVHIEIAYQWLLKNLHLADDDLCLIHCDVGLHNMLIDNGNITALLDWELACLGSPAREIAKILHLIDFLMPRDRFYREYLGAGGAASACEPQRLNFYAVMNYLVTNQRARYANHLFFKGPRSNIVLANAGYDSCYRVTSLLAKTLSAVDPH